MLGGAWVQGGLTALDTAPVEIEKSARKWKCLEIVLFVCEHKRLSGEVLLLSGVRGSGGRVGSSSIGKGGEGRFGGVEDAGTAR